MAELKLFKVYYLGNQACFHLRVAQSPEEALLQCFEKGPSPKPRDAAERSCRVEEVVINGYRIKVEKV